MTKAIIGNSQFFLSETSESTASNMAGADSSKTQPPQAEAELDRAKRARKILNKTVPALFASTPRAKQGVESAD